MKINVSPAPLADQKKDAFIVFYQGTENLLPGGHAALKKQINLLVGKSAFKGGAGQTAIFPLAGKHV